MGNDHGRDDARSGLSGSRTSGRRSRSRPITSCAQFTASTTRSTPTRAGPSTTAITGSATTRTSSSSSRAQCLNEPHSTKQIEDFIGWALETDPTTLVDTIHGLKLGGAERWIAHAAGCAMPDACASTVTRTGAATRPGRGAGQADGRWLVTLEGSGHLPEARDPVRVNLLLHEFLSAGAAAAAVGRSAGRPRAARVGRSTSPRRSALGTRAVMPRSRVSCAGCAPIWRSTGWRSIRSRRCWPPRASGSTRRARMLASESAHISSESDGHRLHALRGDPADG